MYPGQIQIHWRLTFNMNDILKDKFNRRFTYLRLSVTNMCNFRCTYCLPNGYKKKKQENFLELNEILNLVTAFKTLGLEKLRITGGEPLIRRDLEEIISEINNHHELDTIALSTNGFNLNKRIDHLFKAGLGALNVSVDSLDPKVFFKVTGRDKLSNVLSGIERAIEIGVPKVKLNAVLLKGMNYKKLRPYLNYVKKRPVSIRFIELMENRSNKLLFEREHFSGELLYNLLKSDGWKEIARKSSDGPAKVLSHSDYLGTIGFILPYSTDFCSSCNRLRVTAHGQLRLCLFSNSGFNLRPYLQSENLHDELTEFIRSKLQLKNYSHNLHYRITGNNENFAQMGG